MLFVELSRITLMSKHPMKQLMFSEPPQQFHTDH